MLVLFVPKHWHIDTSGYDNFVNLMKYPLTKDTPRRGFWSRVVEKADMDGKDAVIIPWIGNTDYAAEHMYTIFGEVPADGQFNPGVDIDVAISEQDFPKILKHWKLIRSMLSNEGRIHQKYWDINRSLNGNK